LDSWKYELEGRADELERWSDATDLPVESAEVVLSLFLSGRHFVAGGVAEGSLRRESFESFGQGFLGA
jgi:hypothetical protein